MDNGALALWNGADYESLTQVTTATQTRVALRQCCQHFVVVTTQWGYRAAQVSR